MHGKQHSQYPENGLKIAKNLEKKWKLLSNMETGNLSFKRERNRVWLVKTSGEKEKKGVKKKNMNDTPCESNIDTGAEEHFLSKNT